MTAELTPSVIAAIAVIVAALISFLVAITTAIIAKEQKVSEFRQTWINELRVDIATMYNLARDCVFALECCRIDHNKNRDVSFNTYNEVHSKLEFKQSLIILRLNPVKDKVFIDSLNSIMIEINGIDSKSNSDSTFQSQIDITYNVISQFQIESHAILKNEWEIVKKGEKHFVHFRDFGEVCLFAFIAAFFVLFYLAKFPEYFPGIN
jgi:hypothetical protein